MNKWVRLAWACSPFSSCFVDAVARSLFCDWQVLRAEYAKDVPTFEKLLAQANGEPDIDADIVEDDSDSGDVDTEFAAVESSSRKCSFTGDRRGSEASRPFSAASITALSAVVNLRRSSSAAYHKPDGTALPSQQLGLTRPVSATVLRYFLCGRF
jgi:hypothetical protein